MKNNLSTETVKRPIITTPLKASLPVLRWNNRSAIPVHLLVIALYCLIIILYTYPLIFNLTTQSHVGYSGSGIRETPLDRDQAMWGMWWVKKALLEFKTNFYHTDYLYYPYGIDLYLHTLTPFNGILSIPFQHWLGLLGSYNLVCLITFVWCGYSAFLLADYLVQDKKSAFVAGVFFTLAPQHYMNLLRGYFNVITLQFLPLYLLYLLKLDHLRLNRSDWRTLLSNRQWWLYTILMALCLTLSTLSDHYLLLISLMITGLYFIWRIFPALLKRHWTEITNLLKQTLPGLFLAGILMSPLLYAIWRTINSGQWAKVNNAALSTDLVALILPPVTNNFVGAKASTFGQMLPLQPHPAEFNSIGLVGLVIAILGICISRKAGWWGFLLAISILFTLGGELQIGTNMTGISLPASWLAQLPVFGVMRYYERWLGPVSLCIAICSAFALNAYLKRLANAASRFTKLKQATLLIGVLALFIFEVEPWPVKLSGNEAVPPKAYTSHVLPQTDHRPILELPVIQKNVAKGNAMYWQTFHERPILSGYISRPYNLDYGDTPFAAFLTPKDLGQPDFIPSQLAEMQHLLSYYNFGYIALYKTKISSAELKQWQTFVAKLLASSPNPYPYYEDEEVIFYKLPEADNTSKIDKAYLLRGGGWGEIEKQPDNSPYRWIIKNQANLWLFSPNSKTDSYLLSFEAASYYRERNVEILINQQIVSKLKIGQSVEPYQIEIASQWLSEGYNSLIIRSVEPPNQPSQHENNQDHRQLSLLFKNLVITRPSP